MNKNKRVFITTDDIESIDLSEVVGILKELGYDIYITKIPENARFESGGIVSEIENQDVEVVIRKNQSIHASQIKDLLSAMDTIPTSNTFSLSPMPHIDMSVCFYTKAKSSEKLQTHQIKTFESNRSKKFYHGRQ